MHSIIPFPRFTSRPSGRCIRGGVVRHRLYRFDREPDGKLECLRTRPSMYSPPESLSNILLQQEINFMGTTIDDTLSIPPTFAILYYISYTIKSIYSKLPYLLITANKFILFISTKSYIYACRTTMLTNFDANNSDWEIVIPTERPPRWNSNREFRDEDWKVGGYKGIRRRCICQIDAGTIYIYIYIARLIYSSNNGAREKERENHKPQVLRRESSTLVNTRAPLQERRIEKLCTAVCARAACGGDEERRRAGRRGTNCGGDIQSITNRSSRVHPTFLVVTVSVSKVGRVVRLRRHASLFPSYPSPTFLLSPSLSFPLPLFNYPSVPKDSSAWLFTAIRKFPKKKRGQEWGTEIIASGSSYRPLISHFSFLRHIHGHLRTRLSPIWWLDSTMKEIRV